MNPDSSKIVLVGFMGAGKTTVAPVLARRLGCAWLDLDDLIQELTGCSARAIITQDGEAIFRERETEALRRALENHPARVLALGGGVWTLERNRALIAGQKSQVVWLDAPFELCWQRLTKGGDTRPLARDQAAARQLYDARRVLYRQAQWQVTVTPAQTVPEIVNDICKELYNINSPMSEE